MMASEFVTRLQGLVEQHGDQIVQDEYGRTVDAPEFNDDDGTCFLVSFDEN
jgi:hypothetical protein